MSRCVIFSLTVAILILSTAPFAPLSADMADKVVGVWLRPENGSHIKFYKCGGSLCGKVAKVTDPSRKDVNNPDPKLRTRPVVGVLIMNGAKKTNANSWEGKLYSTDSGKTFNGTVTILDESSLQLRGCVFARIFCRNENWSRVK